MIIEFISLKNFRNYFGREFDFSSGITLVIGPNASGKTNLLEAICLLATGKSFRAEVEEELINYQAETANLKSKIFDGKETKELEIILTRGEIQGRRVAKKIYKINGVNRRMLDFVGNLRHVYFGPENLEIVTDSPSLRRDYLDSALEQVDHEYRRASLSYKKGLRQRNRLLEQIRDEGKPRSSLFFWDKLLLENGEIITRKREEFIEFCDKSLGEKESKMIFGGLEITYEKSVISPARLAQYEREEVAAGMTLVGPHRDDFSIFALPAKAGKGGRALGRDLSKFGSRGEQRLAVLLLKLAELEFMEEKTNERPVFLLDDVFSELDHYNRRRLMEIIPQQQTIITATDLHMVPADFLKKGKLIELDNK